MQLEEGHGLLANQHGRVGVRLAGRRAAQHPKRLLAVELHVTVEGTVPPDRVDLATCGMVLEKNGEIVATGAGAAALGSPLNAVAWLANTLSTFGIGLSAGEVLLSGSLAALVPVEPGDSMSMRIGGIGGASVRFA